MGAFLLTTEASVHENNLLLINFMNKLLFKPHTEAIEGTGEVDGVCYQQRAVSLGVYAAQLAGESPIFFHDMVASQEEFEIAAAAEGLDPAIVEIAGSGVLRDPKLGIKSQLHKPFDTVQAPTWFNFELAGALEGLVPDGYTTFSVKELHEAVVEVLLKHDKVRIKLGTGSSGEGQCSVSSPEQVADAIAQLGDISWESGVVVEEDLGKVTPVSVTLLQTSKGTFTAVGTILEETSGTENHYLGTTSVVASGMPEDMLKLGVQTVTITDAKYGQITISLDANVLEMAQAVFDAYQLALIDQGLAVLPRLNIDLLVAEDGRVYFVDPSLRIGGNSGNEYIGALNCLGGMNFSVSSARTVIGTKEEGDPYRNDPLAIALFDAPSPDIYPAAECVSFFVINQNEGYTIT